MNKKYLVYIACFLVLIILFFPFKWKTHEDGTKEYSALTVKYISWNYSRYIDDSIIGTSKLKIYFFPENQKDFETLRDDFFASVSPTQ